MKPVLFIAITPTGTLTLGHYCGIIAPLLEVQEKYEIIIMIADLHALTTFQKDFDYSTKSKEIITLLFASGLKTKTVECSFNLKF